MVVAPKIPGPPSRDRTDAVQGFGGDTGISISFHSSLVI
jgi:hypothetical protein